MLERPLMSDAARPVTAAELEKLPKGDHRYELAQGRVIKMSPVGYLAGRIVMQFGARLFEHVRARRLGVVLTELGVTLTTNPDTVRAPDLAFIRRERIPATEPTGFWKRGAGSCGRNPVARRHPVFGEIFE